MDAVDSAIIDALRADARISNAALAQKVGLTPGPCLRRVQRLEADGVILGYSAEISPEVLGQSFEVGLDVDLRWGDRETVQHFEDTMAGYGEVLELLRLFGTPDYYARVAVEDLAAYERFLTKKVLTIPGIQGVESGFPMKIVKSQRPHAHVAKSFDD